MVFQKILECSWGVPAEHRLEHKMEKELVGKIKIHTWVIDILLRIPAPSSSFWILYFTLAHHICAHCANFEQALLNPQCFRDQVLSLATESSGGKYLFCYLLAVQPTKYL